MPSWLPLDRTSLSRRRKRESLSSVHTATSQAASTRTERARPQDAALRASPTPDRPRKAKNGNDRQPTSSHKRSETLPTLSTLTKQSFDDDHRAKNFTVGNVGAGGTLYLQPSRLGQPNPSFAPATPPASSDGPFSLQSRNPHSRQSDLSGTWTPRLHTARNAAMAGIAVPPLSLASPHNLPRSRSYSCSRVSDRFGSTTHDTDDFQLLLDGANTPRLRRSSSTADLPTRGLVDVNIPHYRLGTPRFSERGTAYLHHSMAASSTGGVPSSVLSRAEYEKLFPVPPGRPVNSFYSHLSAGGHLHPSSAYVANALSQNPMALQRPSIARVISRALFDSLEANLDDPAVVRYHPTTGRIVAATPARLIAQITSPQFLDYELLADFFLAFRCFMSCSDVLELLFARMRWAFASGNDAGRIARVRTFVALRHWILNYFADDFVVDTAFRQTFCDLVNELVTLLRRRPDRGGSDINIVGELKKCWRRTCALYWPIPDAHEISPDADIVPGGEQRVLPSESALSLPLTIRPASGRRSVFEMTQINLPDRPDLWGSTSHPNHNMNGASQRSTRTSRVASIPASPSSEQSLEVLSCSVPFLRHLRPTVRAREKPTPPKSPATRDKNGNPHRPRHGHKRSGSFTDALRDKRTPLSSPKADNIELKDLRSFTITGGLIRGILLQPCTAKVDNNVPITPAPPGPELTEARLAANDTYYSNGQPSNTGVRKLVGEVRRALSNRKGGSVSPSRSGASSGSESREIPKRRRSSRKQRPDYQQLPGPPRLDILGLRIENSYQDAVDSVKQQRPESALQSVQENPIPERPFREHTPEEVMPEIDYNEKPLPEPPRGFPPRPTTAMQDLSHIPLRRNGNPGPDTRDFERLNSHVTTGSRSIVIVDATGAPQLPMMSGGLPSFSSASPEMMPVPLFRDRDDFLPLPPIPRSTESQPTSHRAQARSHDSAFGISDDRMHDLLTEPSAWELIDPGSRANSHDMSSSQARRSSPVVHLKTFQMQALPQQLRRRPGGDLKAADHVHELAPKPQRRHSEASLSTASRSYALSEVYSTDAVAPGGVKISNARSGKQKSVSLIQSLSSQPIIRASFVAEAERLKSMPDTDTDGGIQDTLLKLEGKIPSPSVSTFSGRISGSGSGSGLVDGRSESRQHHREQAVLDVNVPQDSQGTELMQQKINNAAKGGASAERTPLLEQTPVSRRMPTGDVAQNYHYPASPSSGLHSVDSDLATEVQGASIFHPSESGIMSVSSHTEYQLPYMPQPSSEAPMNAPSPHAPVVMKDTRVTSRPYQRMSAAAPEAFLLERRPDSMLDAESDIRYPSFQHGPWGDNTNPSFLLDDNETLSDISTQLSSWHEDDAGARSFFFDDTGEEDAVKPLPVRVGEAPPTPPSTIRKVVGESPERAQLFSRLVSRGSNRPLKGMISHPRLVPQSPNQPFPRRPHHSSKASQETSPPSFPAHLPFVLAFESEVIAEQLTIIEKDALDEVDWKDLISLNWSQNPPDVRNWVEYVNNRSTNGIDMIIARFNLVVKWCVSEIILTELPSERARAITKYIHIASHCHRLHNYASTYQIILALISADLTRLHKTWSLVALRDRQMLGQLEELCRPVRNFHILRQEMETAMPGDGIIPFMGLYTHDLMFNALKSSRIESPQHGREALINFERYQTAAMIVKNLLRLIEASARYTFRPDPEALSRCLWIAALEDQEITARSRALEEAT